jgi:predicted dehydrogenase
MRKASIRTQLEDIVESISGDGKINVDGEEGLKTLQIVEAIYDSSATGREVRIS